MFKRNLTYVVLAGLQIFAGAPQVSAAQAPNGAFEALKRDLEERLCPPTVFVCKDYSIIVSKTIELSRADKANHVSAKWAVGLQFLQRFKNSANWTELNHCGIAYLQNNNVWKLGELANCDYLRR